MFVHGITGCDTTSRLYGIGKAVSLSKIQCCDELSKIADVFMQDNANKDDIVKAGEKALVVLYNGNSEDDLGALQYKRFQEKVVKSCKHVDAMIYHQLLHQQNSTVSGCTIRFKIGGENLII